MKQAYIIFIGLLCVIAFARADETCGDGYTLSVFDPSSAVVASGGECYAGYEPYTGNLGNFRFITTPNNIVCPAGQHMSGGACVADTVGNCANGFHDADIGVASAVQSIGGECYSGYQAQQTNRNVAYLIVSPNPTCGSGYYPTPNGCVAHATADCPNNYYAVGPTGAFVRADGEGACATNYAPFNDTDICLRFMGDNISEFCTPQLACGGGATTIRTSTGVNLPIYGESVTTPSVYIGFNDGTVCHTNLVPGAGTNTINLKYNNETYHGVE